MKSQSHVVLRSNLLLLLAATIWGFAFVAQRVGTNYIGAFTFNGARFILGACTLLPLLLWRRRHTASPMPVVSCKTVLLGGIAAGVIMFLGAYLQQFGVKYTTAGNAGFITCLYVILVPIFGIFLKQPMNRDIWIGAILAVIGMYLLSVTAEFHVNFGDIFVFIGAFFWALHVQFIGWISRRADAIVVAFIQYIACAVFSLICACLFESATINAFLQSSIAIAYCGILSVGVAFTLQIVGQRHAQASHAAIIMSLEAVFAALGGWLFLRESLTFRGLIGCGLMLLGMLASQSLFSNISLKRLYAFCFRTPLKYEE
ncbi:predicted transporter protein [Candidatus Moduliflexus flocculans]|uniref:Predicted transporter protein n=1 Tax=Candidatus Moduliflexus flocculans TaxID=1499966 RepID=A0A0S6W5H3_9BACT|nr:predicted transporter protein [Candidatus Moduliflexus flocculans]